MADKQDKATAYRSVATNMITAMSEIDKNVAEQKSKVYKMLDDRGAIGFLDMFGRDMGRDPLRQSHRAIDDMATRHRAEVIDMAKSNLEALRTRRIRNRRAI